MSKNHMKVAFVGLGGVGKSTIIRLLTDQRVQKTYKPTIGIDFGTIKMGECDVALWDLAGQDRFRFMWPGFLRGSKILFFVTDSTPQNVLRTKQLLEKIEQHMECFKNEVRGGSGHPQKEYKKIGFGYDRSSVKIVVIANKQDLPGSMRPNQVENLLGKKTYPMIAIDPKKRVEMYWILQNMIADTAKEKVAS
ncbi:MAG: ADP-ribosylation factor-like protein [Candidatus Ranarchaeia archaeon]